MPRYRLGEILLRTGLIDQRGLDRALDEQQRWGGPIGRHLVDLGLISEETLVRALSAQFNLPAVALDPPRLHLATAQLVPVDICRKYGLVAFRADQATRFLDVAVSEPANPDLVAEVQAATGYNVRVHIAAQSRIQETLDRVFGSPLGATAELNLDIGPADGAGGPMRIEGRAERPLEEEDRPPWSMALAPGGADSVEDPDEARPRHDTIDVQVTATPLAGDEVEARIARLEEALVGQRAAIDAILHALGERGLISEAEVRRLRGGR